MSALKDIKITKTDWDSFKVESLTCERVAEVSLDTKSEHELLLWTILEDLYKQELV